MPGALTNVVKGGSNGRADQRLSRRPGESVAEFRQRLQELRNRFVGGMALVDIAAQKLAVGKDERVVRNPVEVKHTRDEFLGDDPSVRFFPQTTDDREDQIVRGAFIRALDLALAPPAPAAPKPIVTYWVITGRTDGAPDAFEAFVAETSAEVHVLLLTPEPAYVPTPPSGGDIVEDMYVVSTTLRIQQIEQRLQQVAYPVLPVPLPGTNGVGCLRVIGY